MKILEKTQMEKKPYNWLGEGDKMGGLDLCYRKKEKRLRASWHYNSISNIKNEGDG